MQAQRNTNRILTVDFARGLMAVGVMLYHLLYYEGIISLPQLGSYAV
jgi:peptidoglycan/LPS O-acetylase OafA/YrhL